MAEIKDQSSVEKQVVTTPNVDIPLKTEDKGFFGNIVEKGKDIISGVGGMWSNKDQEQTPTEEIEPITTPNVDIELKKEEPTTGVDNGKIKEEPVKTDVGPTKEEIAEQKRIAKLEADKLKLEQEKLKVEKEATDARIIESKNAGLNVGLDDEGNLSFQNIKDQVRYEDFNKYKNSTTSELSQALIKGEIDQVTYNAITSVNPEAAEEAKVNSSIELYNSVVNNEQTDLQKDLINKINEFVNKNRDNNEFVSDYTSLENKSARIDSRLRELDNEKNRLRDRVKKDNPGVSPGLINAILGEELDAINDEIFSLSNEKLVNNSDINTLIKGEEFIQKQDKTSLENLTAFEEILEERRKTAISYMKDEFNVANTEMVNNAEIERTKKENEENIARTAKLLEESIARQDEVSTMKHKQSLESLKIKQENLIEITNLKNEESKINTDATSGGTLTPEQSIEALSLSAELGRGLTVDGKKELSSVVKSLISKGYSSDEITDYIKNKNIGTEFTGVVRNAFANMTSELSKEKRDNNRDELENSIKDFGLYNDRTKSLIKKIGRDSMSADQAKNVLGAEEVIDAMDGMDYLVKKLGEKGKLGLLSGKTEDVLRKIGQTSDPELLELSSMATATLQSFRKARTGVAFGEQEGKEYKDLFFNKADNLEANLAKSKGLKNLLNLNLDTAYGSVMGLDNYNELIKSDNKRLNSNVAYNNSNIEEVIQRDIDRIGGSDDLNATDIIDSANEYGINPNIVAAFIRNDTSYGKNMYSKNNFGNVGNNDTLVAEGKEGVKFNTAKSGIDAVSKNLKSRIDAYKAKYGEDKIPTAGELATGRNKDNGTKFFGVYMTSKDGQKNVESIYNQLNGDTIVEETIAAGFEQVDTPTDIDEEDDGKGFIEGTIETAIKPITEFSEGMSKLAFEGIQSGIDLKTLTKKINDDFLTDSGVSGPDRSSVMDILNSGKFQRQYEKLGDDATAKNKLIEDVLKNPFVKYEPKAINNIVSFLETKNAIKNREPIITSQEALGLPMDAINSTLTAAFPTSAAIISAGVNTPVIKNMLGALGTGVTWTGKQINKTPGLKNFRELLTDEDKQKFDALVGGGALAVLLKGTSIANKKYGITGKIKSKFSSKIGKKELLGDVLDVKPKDYETLGLNTEGDAVSFIKKAQDALDDGLSQLDDANLKKIKSLDDLKEINKQKQTQYETNKQSLIKGKNIKVSESAKNIVKKLIKEFDVEDADINTKNKVKRLKEILNSDNIKVTELDGIVKDYTNATKPFQGQTTTQKNISKANRDNVISEIEQNVKGYKDINSKISNNVTADKLLEKQLSKGQEQLKGARIEKKTGGTVVKSLERGLSMITLGKSRAIASALSGFIQGKSKYTVADINKKYLPTVIKAYKKAGLNKTDLSKDINSLSGDISKISTINALINEQWEK